MSETWKGLEFQGFLHQQTEDRQEILIMRGGVAHQLTTQLVFQQFAIGIHHQFYEVVKLDLGAPAQNALGFARVALEIIYFRRAEISGIDFDILFPVETSKLKSGLQEFANAMSLAGGDDKVVRAIELHHAPHGIDILRGITPVAFGLKIAHVEFLLQTGANPRYSSRDLAAHESLSSTWRFVIEKNAVAGEETITFPVIHCHPVRVDLRASIRAARPERSILALWRFRRCTKHFAAGGLVELGLEPYYSYCLQETDRSECSHIACVFRELKTDLYMALSAQVINFLRMNLVKELDQTRRIRQVSKMQEQPSRTFMPIGKDSVNARCIETARPPLEAMDLVALRE